MICEKVDLYDFFALPREGRTGGYLAVFAHEKETEISVRERPAMLVVPGGGYNMLSEREAEPVATAYYAQGFQTFILDYSLQTAYHAPLIEAAMAVAYIRLSAEAYRVNKSHVAAIGFSAGGNLCGMLATLFADDAIKKALGKRAELARPDAVVLAYGVLSLGKFGHTGTADNITGGDEALKKRLSPELCVTKDSSPAFLWHTTEDDCVSVQCSVLYANACLEAGVPVELHLFEQGRHGLSVLNADVHGTAEIPFALARNAVWIELSLSWLKMRGFEVREKTEAK